MKGPWNLGLKVKDIEAELRFLECCGATGVEQGVITSAAGDEPFGMAFLGPQRLLLFRKVIYEDALPAPVPHGLRHAVFQVDDLAQTLAAYAREGVTPFWGPQELSTPFGRRRIAFFRSPSDFIFETFEHIP